MNDQPKRTYIYALIDPCSLRIRYVGKSNNPRERRSHHYTKPHFNAAKTKWLLSLLAENKAALIGILEDVPIQKWQEREKFWIQRLKDSGEPLLNVAAGGAGATVGVGRRGQMPEETRRKISLALKGNPRLLGRRGRTGAVLSLETRKKISSSLIGHPSLKAKKSAETRARMSLALKGNCNGKGKHPSQETIERRRLSLCGRKHSEATKKKISESQRLRLSGCVL